MTAIDKDLTPVSIEVAGPFATRLMGRETYIARAQGTCLDRCSAIAVRGLVGARWSVSPWVVAVPGRLGARRILPPSTSEEAIVEALVGQTTEALSLAAQDVVLCERMRMDAAAMADALEADLRAAAEYDGMRARNVDAGRRKARVVIDPHELKMRYPHSSTPAGPMDARPFWESDE